MNIPTKYGDAAVQAALPELAVRVTVQVRTTVVPWVTVTVAVGSANAAPTIDTSVGLPDPGTGDVTGGVTATDPDGDTIAYSLATAPTKGTATVSGDGAFAYTPTAEARHTAAADAATSEDQQDSFAITVDDGHGASSTVSVSVAISPANAAPTPYAARRAARLAHILPSGAGHGRQPVRE